MAVTVGAGGFFQCEAHRLERTAGKWFPTAYERCAFSVTKQIPLLLSPILEFRVPSCDRFKDAHRKGKKGNSSPKETQFIGSSPPKAAEEPCRKLEQGINSTLLFLLHPLSYDE